MNREVAEALVRSLIGRLSVADGSYRLPEGRLSAEEVTALRLLIESSPPNFRPETDLGLGGSGPGEESEPSTAIEAPAPKAQPFASLDTSVLDLEGPDEEDLRICLDFGTAMSKAWATGKGVEETIPLVLGRQAGIGDKLAVPSSVFISKSGRIYLGAAAETQHRQELEAGRQRFDNLKRMLSEAEVGQNLDDVPLPQAIDPTASGLTRGDLLTLYIAWLTHLSIQTLNDVAKTDGFAAEENQRSFRSVRRRFAIPCFEHAIDEQIGGTERAQWAECVMENAVLRAQVVADTLRGSWGNLTVDRVRNVLLEVRQLDSAKFRGLLTRTSSVREPIAAGASRFEEELSDVDSVVRRYLLVVDAGAGTSDFALFEVFHNSEDEWTKYGLIQPSVRMTRDAGNAVDAILRPLILRACGVDPANGSPLSEEDFVLVKTDLASQIRDFKHLIFNQGGADISLRPNVRGFVELDVVVTDPGFQDLGGRLLEARRSILADLFRGEFRDRIRQSGQRMPIYVLLSGGSSSLPIIQSLAKGNLDIEGAEFRFEHIDALPDWINTLEREDAELVAANYPQCAVAIGGSAPELPIEISDLPSPITPPPPGSRTLERYQVTGMG